MASHGIKDRVAIVGMGCTRFVEHWDLGLDDLLIDAANIQELGDELFSLVEKESRKNLLLNFASVEFLSSAALNKLIILDKKVKAHNKAN